ncbi:MAG: hypothetical protein NC390_02780 [Fusobacterium sp.]|nr:hypothetical protein [Fusobacterium sp.]
MVGISDGNNDGKFKIQRGQGISQAIASELGLNSQQCRKLGSVWNEIFKEVDKQNQQTQIYAGGNNLHGQTNKNYVVHTNQVIEFSKEIWAKIVQLVNEKLGTDIQTGETTAPPAATNPPAADETQQPQQPATPPRNNPPSNEAPPAPVKVSIAGIAPKIPTTPYLAEAPDVSAAVKQLKGETQSNWAVSSKMKSALNTVNKNNVAYFIEEYNEDGSDIVTDIDDCTGWNKKDIYENLTKPLMARAKELGIDISGYDVAPKTVKSTRAVGSAGAITQVSTTEYPSLNAQRQFLKEVSSQIISDEYWAGPQVGFLKKYKPQIDKANATIKKFADASVENISITPYKNNDAYTMTLEDGSQLQITIKDNTISDIHVKNKTSPDNINDLSYDFGDCRIFLDPDEKTDGTGNYKVGSNYLYDAYIPFDKLKEVATNLLKKMGVEVK